MWFNFWNMAYSRKWVTLEQVKMAVKTEANTYGQISAEEYQTITGEEYK